MYAGLRAGASPADVIAEAKNVTYDMGGTAKTLDMANAVAAHLQPAGV
jgi:isocitrate/isopropylmalate dehydrogenase